MVFYIYRRVDDYCDHTIDDSCVKRLINTRKFESTRVGSFFCFYNIYNIFLSTLFEKETFFSSILFEKEPKKSDR